MAIERRRRNLRIVLFIIIVATLPFYCAGIILLGTAPQRSPIQRTATVTRGETQTAPTATIQVFPSITPLSQGFPTQALPPTPGQFIPPTVGQVLPPTSILPTATFWVFPTSTTAPTLTPFPTETPFPTDPPPTDPPPATDTPLPFPTDPPPVIPTETETATATMTIDPLLPDDIIPPGS